MVRGVPTKPFLRAPCGASASMTKRCCRCCRRTNASMANGDKHGGGANCCLSAIVALFEIVGVKPSRHSSLVTRHSSVFPRGVGGVLLSDEECVECCGVCGVCGAVWSVVWCAGTLIGVRSPTEQPRGERCPP